VCGHGIATAVGDAFDGRLERRIRERLDLAAVVAHEVMVMVAAGVRRLEARDAVSEVDPLDEPELVHAVERPVHACDSHAFAAGAHTIVDLLGREATVLLAEYFDDEPPRAPAPAARRAQAVERVLAPAGRHVDNDTRSQRRATVPTVRWVAILFAAGLLTGCGGSDDDERTLVAGFYPLAWAAERIADDDIRVVNLTPAGAEPHDIELTPRDVEQIDGADVVLYLGHGFQPALEDAARGQAGVVDLLEGEQLLAGDDEHEDEGGGFDPHVWLDPGRFSALVARIGEALDEPESAAVLAAELDELDSEFGAGLADCERRDIVTSHAAFGYLAQAYGLNQIALTGVSPEAEPSPRALEDLIEHVREEGATTVFFESLVSPELAETVARETGARTAELDPLEGISQDDLDAGDDYFSVMRANLSALREALGCR
jgi:zinc transport system substrate-binding protein